jgi:uncharacterized protein YkwD
MHRVSEHLRRTVAFMATVLCCTGLAAIPAQAAPPARAAQSCAGADLIPSSTNAPEIRGATLCLLNAERRAHRLRSLRSNSRLRRAAQSYAQQMVQQDFFAHVSPSGSTLIQRIRRTAYLSTAHSWSVGENLAWGTGALATPAETVQNWMDSPPHRHNILTRSFKEIGIGVALGAPGQGADGATYTTEFGRRS